MSASGERPPVRVRLLDAALEYAGHGWLIFPCKPRGKEPLTPKGFHDATADTETIRRWWTETPDANIGLHPGRAGLVVIDLDGPEADDEAAKLGLLSEPTLTVRTARGEHRYYRHPGGTVPNVRLGARIDVRGDAGYVLVPPSVHPSGARYRTAVKLTPIPLPPQALEAILRAPAIARTKARELPPRIPEGERNAALTSLAGSARRRGAGSDEILALLRETNRLRCVPPLAEKELGGIADSIGRYAPAANPSPNGAGAATTAVLVNLSTVKAERVAWLWPGRIPLGKLTVLDGDPGLGKSTLLLDVAARVTVAAQMPDGARADLDGAAGAVILSAEDGLADTIRPRLDEAGADCKRVVALTKIVGPEDVERLPTVSDVLAIEQAIDAVGARLVIVDPLVAYLASETDSHRDQDVRRALSLLAELAERHGVAVVVVRHLRKSAGGNPLYRGGGSIGIIGAARAGLLVAPDPAAPDGPRRILASTKMNLSAPPRALAYRLEVGPNRVVKVAWEGETDHSADQLLAEPTGSEERSAVDEATAFLLDVLAGGPQPVEDMRREARKAGHAERTLERAKARLGIRSRREGGIAGQGRWVWELPPTPPPSREKVGGGVSRDLENIGVPPNAASAIYPPGGGDIPLPEGPPEYLLEELDLEPRP